MGCGSSKASTAVLPAEMVTKPGLAVDKIVTSGKIPRDTKSGKSNSSADSGFDDSDAEIPSTGSSPDEITQPDTREVAMSPQVAAKGGVSFDIQLDTPPTRKRMPPRLKALVQTPKREVTLLELHKQQQAANARRAQQLEDARKRAAEESNKVNTVAHKLTREKTTLGNEMDNKEARALENRQKHLNEMRNKLKAQENKAKKVRDNKRIASGKSTGSQRSLSAKSANSISSGQRV